jgi:hypothetical protein
MHLEPAFLPAQRHEARKPEPSAEAQLGELVMNLAAVIGLAVSFKEVHWEGKPSDREIKAHGVELLVAIVPLAKHRPDFLSVARREAKLELRRQRALNLIALNDDWLDELVDKALEMISATARKTGN